MMIFAASLILAIHAAWIGLVIFGAFWTRNRPVWSAIHILALIWGILVEVSPWPCPLTIIEQYLETRAGAAAYQGSFLVHYLDAIVYPNLPGWVLTLAGVAVCAGNLAIHGWRLWKRQISSRKTGKLR